MHTAMNELFEIMKWGSIYFCGIYGGIMSLIILRDIIYSIILLIVDFKK